jgi:pre-mRNA-splicing factor CWC26
MPDPNLQAYLAAKYLSGPRAEAILARHGGEDGVKKKKKRKREATDPSAASGSGLVIRDELESWKRSAQGDDEDDLLLGDAHVVEADAESSRKAKFKKAFRGAEEEEGKPDAEDERPEIAGEDGLNLGIDDQARLHNARDAAAVAEDGSASVSAPAPPAEPPRKPRSGLMTKEEMRAERLERERQEAEKRARENEEHEADENAAHQRRGRGESSRGREAQAGSEGAREEGMGQGHRAEAADQRQPREIRASKGGRGC